METKTLKNVSIQSLDGGQPISLDDAELIFGDQTTLAPKGVLSGANLISRTLSLTANLDPGAYGALMEVLNPGPKRTPCLDAVVDWDPWRNPAAFWRLMAGLLMKGQGVRLRIRQATAADRLKGGTLA